MENLRFEGVCSRWRIEDMHYWVMKLPLQADQGRSEPLLFIQSMGQDGIHACLMRHVIMYPSIRLLRLDLGVGLYGDVLVGLEGANLVLGELSAGKGCQQGNSKPGTGTVT